MCGSGSRKLLNTDPIRIQIHNTGSMTSLLYTFLVPTVLDHLLHVNLDSVDRIILHLQYISWLHSPQNSWKCSQNKFILPTELDHLLSVVLSRGHRNILSYVVNVLWIVNLKNFSIRLVCPVKGYRYGIKHLLLT